MSITTGFITGTGFYRLPSIRDMEKRQVETPFGDMDVEIGILADQEVAFIPRHGSDHSIAPADINYRANLYAMHDLGVERILATSVSGSLVRSWKPGTLVLIDQFLNFTSGRDDSFYPLDGKLAHIDVTNPYCSTLHCHLQNEALELGLDLQRGGTYACFDGPRFETRAEIEMVRRLGGDLVGHTNYPECVLARELAMCYATVGVVSNLAAGVKDDEVTATEVTENMAGWSKQISALFEEIVLRLDEHYDCSCRHALDEAFL